MKQTEVNSMVKSELLGYVRRSNSGKALKISISTDAFEKAERYTTQNGQEYVAMIIRLDKIYQLIEGHKDVTNITQIQDN
jgi:hypothetical protein